MTDTSLFIINPKDNIPLATLRKMQLPELLSLARGIRKRIKKPSEALLKQGLAPREVKALRKQAFPKGLWACLATEFKIQYSSAAGRAVEVLPVHRLTRPDSFAQYCTLLGTYQGVFSFSRYKFYPPWTLEQGLPGDKVFDWYRDIYHPSIDITPAYVPEWRNALIDAQKIIEAEKLKARPFDFIQFRKGRRVGAKKYRAFRETTGCLFSFIQTTQGKDTKAWWVKVEQVKQTKYNRVCWNVDENPIVLRALAKCTPDMLHLEEERIWNKSLSKLESTIL